MKDDLAALVGRVVGFSQPYFIAPAYWLKPMEVELRASHFGIPGIRKRTIWVRVLEVGTTNKSSLLVEHFHGDRSFGVNGRDYLNPERIHTVMPEEYN